MNTLIALSGLGVFCLIAEIFNLRKVIVPVVILGLLAVLGTTLHLWTLGFSANEKYSNMIAADSTSSAFASLFILLTIFIVAMGNEVYKDHPTKISDYISIKVFLLAGAIAMISFTNLAMFFIGIETLSIALYI